MTRQDFILKWLFYALALLPAWWLDLFVLNRFTLFGVSPRLLPVAAITVAVLEGAVGGAGFGLAVGALCDAVYYGAWGGMTLGLCLLGWGAGAASQYALRRNFGGCLLCCAAGLSLLELIHVAFGLFIGLASLYPLLRVAVPEMLLSLCTLCILYPWFAWVHRRVPKPVGL